MTAPARATMDFFAAQAAARRRTALLVVYFVLAVAGTVGAVWVGVSVALAIQPGLGIEPFGEGLAVAVAVLVGGTTLGGSAWHATRLADGGHAVARLLGGVPVDRGTSEPGERRFVNVAEEMAIAAGLPVPALYVLPGEGAINAFAAGLTPDQAVVAVTRGALDRLERDELQGVIAHEYSHVLNGDARLNVRLLSVVGGITAVAAVGRILFELGGDSGRRRWRVTSSSRRSGGGLILLVGLVVWAAGSVGAFFGRLIRAAVSRQREHLADAASVQFTRNPDGLAGALAKIAHAGSAIGSTFAPEASHLFFANGLASEWLATHPPIKDRIDRILPNGYLRVMRLAAEAGAPDDRAATELAGGDGAAEALAPGTTPAFAGAPAPLTPSSLVASVGRLDPRRVAAASAMLGALPAAVSAAARRPAGAAALLRALLAGGPPAGHAAQLAVVVDPATRAEVAALAAALATLSPGSRSAVLDLALPALDGLSPAEADALDAELSALSAADGRTTLFEWALLRIVRRRRAHRARAAHPARLRLDDVQVDVLDLLSTVSWAGTRAEAGAQAALDTALPVLGVPVGWRVLPRDRISAKRLDAALDRLDGAIPPLKARLVEACAAAVLFDGRALAPECELLRAVAASLGVPVPPIEVTEARAETGVG